MLITNFLKNGLGLKIIRTNKAAAACRTFLCLILRKPKGRAFSHSANNYQNPPIQNQKQRNLCNPWFIFLSIFVPDLRKKNPASPVPNGHYLVRVRYLREFTLSWPKGTNGLPSAAPTSQSMSLYLGCSDSRLKPFPPAELLSQGPPLGSHPTAPDPPAPMLLQSPLCF